MADSKNIKDYYINTRFMTEKEYQELCRHTEPNMLRAMADCYANGTAIITNYQSDEFRGTAKGTNKIKTADTSK